MCSSADFWEIPAFWKIPTSIEILWQMAEDIYFLKSQLTTTCVQEHSLLFSL